MGRAFPGAHATMVQASRGVPQRRHSTEAVRGQPERVEEHEREVHHRRSGRANAADSAPRGGLPPREAAGFRGREPVHSPSPARTEAVGDRPTDGRTDQKRGCLWAGAIVVNGRDALVYIKTDSFPTYLLFLHLI